MAFTAPIDIWNRALQHCEVRKIATIPENSKAYIEAIKCYDALRTAEMRSRLWKFMGRTSVLRATSATTQVLTFPAYAAGTTYAAGRIVTDNGYDGNTMTWISVVGSNLANTPKSSPAYWQEYFGSPQCDTYSASVSYYIGEIVLLSAVYYISATDGNVGNAPASGAPWIVLSGVTSSTLFLPGSLTANRAGTTQYAYPIPFGFLRIAPQDIKQAGGSFSATSGGMQFSNMEFRGKYIVSTDTSPLIFRFGADVQDVTQMDPMFCELVAAGMGIAMCPILTGNLQKVQGITSIYNAKLAEATKMNAIEIGNTEADEASFIVSRDPEDMGVPAQQGR